MLTLLANLPEHVVGSVFRVKLMHSTMNRS
jgi:hypothetical protein